MTNILFGTNSAVLSATVTASSTATGYSGNNLLTGPKSETWKSNGAVASATLKYAATAAVNYLALGGVHTLTDVPGSTVTLTLEYSDDDSSYTTWATAADLSPLTIGASSASGEDKLITAALSASHPYWRLTIDPSADATIEMSKMYLGTALDLGRDPNSIKIRRVDIGQYAYRTPYQIELQYTGIDYDTAMSLVTNVIARAGHHPIFMFTAESNTYSHGVLLNNYLYFVEVVDYSVPQRITAENDISLTLRESL